MSAPLVVNTFGAPNSGKTTFAAALVAALARRGVRVTLVQEVATQCIQAGDTIGLKCQVYLLGETARRIRQCVARGYEVVVVEAPLLLNAVYDAEQSPALRQLCREEHRRHRTLNLLLEPIPPAAGYDATMRVHTPTEAAAIHDAVIAMLQEGAETVEAIPVEGREQIPAIYAARLERMVRTPEPPCAPARRAAGLGPTR